MCWIVIFRNSETTHKVIPQMRQHLLDQVAKLMAVSVQKPELAEAGQHHLLMMG